MANKRGLRGRDNRNSVRERAYLHIWRKIASGEFGAGDSISELAVARQIGVSRTPVREAIGQLAAEGLLEQSPNRRAVVARVTRQDIIELYELREALEVYAVGKAARRPLHQADLDKLLALNDAALALKDQLDPPGGSELNQKQMLTFAAYDLGFHSHLMRLAENARILKVVTETRLLIRIFAIERHGHTALLLEDIHRRHAEVVHAIAEQNPERAMGAIAEHIRISLRERLDDFDRWEIESSLLAAVPRSMATRSLFLDGNLWEGQSELSRSK